MPGATRRERGHRDWRGRVKVAYGSLPTAEAAARRLARQQGWPVDVYRCRVCESLHLARGRDDHQLGPQALARVWPGGEVDRAV